MKTSITRLLLSAVLMMCCTVANAVGTQPSVGDGTSDNPYQIATKDNLLWFADQVNNGQTSINAELTADIIVNNNVLDSNGNLNSGTFTLWTPIGGFNGEGNDYSGEFDGNGHTISGLYFNNTEVKNVGLFGKTVNNAYIHDLGVSDSYFYGQDHVGSICGDFASGKIENCWSEVAIYVTFGDGGGLTGSVYINSVLKNSYTICSVEGNGSRGLVCGAFYGTIENCYAKQINSAGAKGLIGWTSGEGPRTATKVEIKDDDAFASGEVCYRLNNGVTGSSQKWYQTLGSDLLPVMDNSHGIVYYGYEGNVLKYSNTVLTIPTTKHEQSAATCNAVGYTVECWEDTKSGRVFAEEACVTELNAAYVITYSPVMTVPEYGSSIAAWPWVMKGESVTYDGVTFINPLEKVYQGAAAHISTEYVYFKIKDATAKNVRLKWHLDKNTFNGELYYQINEGDKIKIDISGNMWVQNLPDLKQDDKVTVYYSITSMSNFPLTWTMSLEYCPGHNLQHTSAKAVTCTENGNKEYWYCTKCKTYFANAECTEVMNDWEIPALGHSAEHHQQKSATCTEDGNIEHWHCTRCNLNYSDETCTEQITGSVVLPATHHANKESIPYKAPTADEEGNIAYWHCNDCGKNFGDEGCTKEVTEAEIILKKLLNVLHIDFAGTSAPIENEHYMGATEIGFNEKGDIVFTVNEQEVTYSASMINEVGFRNGAPTIELTANKDPNGSEHYTTFYSGLEAYTIPEGVKAYTATVDEKLDGVILLSEIKDEVIPAKTAVVLISENGSYNAFTSDYAISETEEERGILKGTDVEIPVPDDNCYVLSGTKALGMGLYPWAKGKTLSANKAYLHLTESSSAKAFTFVFDDEPSGIESLTPTISEGEGAYNLQGIRVNAGYKGIVIKNGKKVYRK